MKSQTVCAALAVVMAAGTEVSAQTPGSPAGTLICSTLGSAKLGPDQTPADRLLLCTFTPAARHGEETYEARLTTETGTIPLGDAPLMLVVRTAGSEIDKAGFLEQDYAGTAPREFERGLRLVGQDNPGITLIIDMPTGKELPRWPAAKLSLQLRRSVT